MAQNFSEAALQAIQAAFELAKERNHPEVSENHLLFSFLSDPEGYFVTLLEELKTTPASLIQKVEEALSHAPVYAQGGGEPSPSTTFQERVRDAEAFAKEMKDAYISSDHFLLSYWKGGGEPFNTWKKGSKISLNDVKTTIAKIRGDRHMDSTTAESSMKSIEKYCKNLTSLAKQGKLDPVIGRDEEIRRTMQVLSRRTKNNPLLIGEPGVGKTAILEAVNAALSKS